MVLAGTTFRPIGRPPRVGSEHHATNYARALHSVGTQVVARSRPPSREHGSLCPLRQGGSSALLPGVSSDVSPHAEGANPPAACHRALRCRHSLPSWPEEPALPRALHVPASRGP